MKVQQISVFLENKAGRLAEVTEVLGKHSINIRALSIADTTNFGILRLIVSDPEAAHTVLRKAGFTVSATDVIAVEVKDEPGGLAKVLGILEGNEINIEYLYAFIQKATNAALVVFRVEQVDEAIAVLLDHQINMLSGDIVYKL